MRKLTVAFCIPADLRDWIKAKAERDQISMSSFLTQLLAKAKRDAD